MWDLGGQTSIRPYWRCYFPNTDAIIFVVDSADVERLAIAKQELCAMLEEEELRDSILLVFANKQDQKGALNASQVTWQHVYLLLNLAPSHSPPCLPSYYDEPMLSFSPTSLFLYLSCTRSCRFPRPWVSPTLETGNGQFRRPMRPKDGGYSKALTGCQRQLWGVGSEGR